MNQTIIRNSLMYIYSIAGKMAWKVTTISCCAVLNLSEVILKKSKIEKILTYNDFKSYKEREKKQYTDPLTSL